VATMLVTGDVQQP